jgi:hypothetical protein
MDPQHWIFGLHSMLYMFFLPLVCPPPPPHAKLRLGSESGSESTLNGKSDPDQHCFRDAWFFGLHSILFMDFWTAFYVVYVLFASCLNSSCSSSMSSCCRSSCALTNDSMSSSLCACAPLLPRDTRALKTARFSSSAS